MISIDEVNLLQAQNEALIKQNRQLQKVCKTLAAGLNKRQQTLQEIKEIAEANQFDFAEGSVISYQSIKEIAKNFEKILKLTKAEEE